MTTTPTPSTTTTPSLLVEAPESSREALTATKPHYPPPVFAPHALKGKKQSPQSIALRAKANSKPIHCHQTGITYPSIKLAAEKLNLKANSIGNVLKGHCNSIKGFTFCYAKIDTTTTTEGEAK